MRRSEFLRAVDVEFGARGAAIVNDLVLSDIGRTSADALDEGVPPRDIWQALCTDMDVPAARRHRAGRLEPRR